MFNLKFSSNNYMCYYKTILTAFFITLLSACSDDDKMVEIPEEITPPPIATPTEFSYEVAVSNLTHAQPLSPITLMLHGDEKMWMIGGAASEGLELIAESGDNSKIIVDSAVLGSASNGEVVMPGESASITITTTDEMASHLTVISMLVNTNDAFSGLTGMDLSSLTVDSSHSWMLGVYDAGTEANSELTGTIPGPADGGVGFDMARDDVDFVAMHPGIVSMDDGLSSSVLTQAHRINNPVIKLTITRIK